MRTIRIFISSPGDVSEERQAARSVIAGLRKRYGSEARLEPVFWEDLPLQADLSFQQAIDLILSRKGVDIAVFILWSRLGSEVAGISRADGSAYRSGTEREFDLMMAARGASPEGSKTPDILVYTRRDDETFTDSLKSSKATSELRDIIEQKSLAESFIRENFVDNAGRNLRAYHTFPKPVDFASRLRVHLIELLDERFSTGARAVWEGNPYRGLHAFQPEHAAVFFGRERESDDLAALLRARERDGGDGIAFACVIGPSGSGKSSVVRAGLASDLCHEPAVEEGGSSVRWMFLSLTPSELLPDFGRRFVEALAGLFPALVANAQVPDLSEGLVSNPEMFVKLSLRPAITAASGKANAPVKTLLLIDQFEEVFTRMAATGNSLLADTFLPLLRALATSGHFWVVTTLRSDFYPAALGVRGFCELRGDRNFDLLPPDGSSLMRIITRPAALAGATFEVLDAKSGTTLADLLLEDLRRQADALPLLQFTLEELFIRRGPGNVLTKEQYDSFGGLTGAINRRAEDVYASLAKEVPAAVLDACFSQAFSRLFEIDFSSGKETPVRATVSGEVLLADSPDPEITRTMLDRFTTARLLVADGQGGGPTYSVAHETLLHDWTRLIHLREKESESLRRRARLRPSHQAYLATPDQSMLLPEGLALHEACQLLKEAPHFLDASQKDYIIRSTEHHRRRRRRIRAWITAALLGLLTLSTVATVAFFHSRNQERIAVAAKEEAEKADHEKQKALESELENLKIYQASNSRTFEALEDYFKEFPEGELLGLFEKFSTFLTDAYTRIPPDRRNAKHQNDYASILEMHSLLIVRQLGKEKKAGPEGMMAVMKAKTIFAKSLEIRSGGLALNPPPPVSVAIAEQFYNQSGIQKDISPQFAPLIRPILDEKRQIVLKYLDSIPESYPFYQKQVVPLREKIVALPLVGK